MEKERPSYYANIPANVRYNKKLPPCARLLYGEITALCNKEGYCWASNKYFADLYDVSPGTISEWVRQLVQYGYIEYRVQNNNTRQIFLKGVSENPEGGIGKIRRGVSEKPEHNNTVNNTKNITTNTSEAAASRKHDPLGAEIIKAFEVVNPACKRYYGRKEQREACDDLIESYGVEQVLRVVAILPQTNGKQYIPTITTPLQLREKWTQLETSLKRKKEELSNSKCIIV